jgi:hypothetical protein
MNSSSASPSCAQKLKDIFFREQKFYNAFVVSIWSVFLKKMAAFSGQAANAGPRVTIVRKHKCTVVWQADVGFSKISIFWLIWVLSTSKRTKKEEFFNFQK